MTWPATWRPLAHARCAWWRQRQKDQRSELSVLYLFCDLVIFVFPNPRNKCLFDPLHIYLFIHPCRWLVEYINSLVILCSFSKMLKFPFPLNTMGGLTFCLPSAHMQSCRVASLLSKPDDGCDTHTCLVPNVS